MLERGPSASNMHKGTVSTALAGLGLPLYFKATYSPACSTCCSEHLCGMLTCVEHCSQAVENIGAVASCIACQFVA